MPYLEIGSVAAKLGLRDGRAGNGVMKGVQSSRSSEVRAESGRV